MNAPAPHHEITLEDKYALQSGRAFMTGTQALVRLPLMQRQRDLAGGLNTACFISGYRGSPLGGFDQALWNARRFIERNHIKFQPGINEEMASGIPESKLEIVEECGHLSTLERPVETSAALAHWLEP